MDVTHRSCSLSTGRTGHVASLAKECRCRSCRSVKLREHQDDALQSGKGRSSLNPPQAVGPQQWAGNLCRRWDLCCWRQQYRNTSFRVATPHSVRGKVKRFWSKRPKQQSQLRGESNHLQCPRGLDGKLGERRCRKQCPTAVIGSGTAKVERLNGAVSGSFCVLPAESSLWSRWTGARETLGPGKGPVQPSRKLD